MEGSDLARFPDVYLLWTDSSSEDSYLTIIAIHILTCGTRWPIQ